MFYGLPDVLVGQAGLFIDERILSPSLALDRLLQGRFERCPDDGHQARLPAISGYSHPLNYIFNISYIMHIFY